MARFPKRRRLLISRRPIARMRRSGRKRNVISRVPRALIVPASKIVQLKYVSPVPYNGGGLDAGASVTANYIFRANSCFDPDLTGTGIQPPGFDQWKQFYTTYEVLASHITWEIIPTPDVGASNPEHLIMCLAFGSPSLATTPYANMIQKAAQPGVKKLILQARGAGGPRNGVGRLHSKFSIRKAFGYGSNSHTEGGVGSNPQEPWYFHLVCANPWDILVDPGSVYVTATITFTVKFSKRVTTIYDT